MCFEILIAVFEEIFFGAFAARIAILNEGFAIDDKLNGIIG